MKTSKRIVSFIVSLVLLLGVVVPVSASSAEDTNRYETLMLSKDETVMPMANICLSCGNPLFVTYGGWSSYVAVGTAACTHGYRHGEDKLYERYRTRVEHCNYCEYSSTSTETQTKRECHGFN